MSDETTTAAATVNPVVANATQALAIKELGEQVAGIRKKIKTLWIAVIVLAVLTVVSAGFSLVPRLGFGMMGNRGNFQRGTDGAPGTFQGAPVAPGTQGGAPGTQGGAPGTPGGAPAQP